MFVYCSFQCAQHGTHFSWYLDSLGPALIGVFLNVTLHGAMGMQCCVYYNYFSRYVLSLRTQPDAD